ncbi:MAG: ZIP family metal transporter [Candidatus Falkowbacteria bacterium]|nr:ZIP family metal transporter [Candidatus Falkowbacteria bacterium]
MLLYSIIATLVVSLISFVGLFSLSSSEEGFKKIAFFLVSLAAGTMVGDVFIHLLPELANNKTTNPWPWIMVGIGLFFILEKFIHWRHCHFPTTEHHPHPVGLMNLIGGGFHNFFDGLLIAASFVVSFPLGLTTTLAVIFHEIPREIGDFGILIHAGYTRKKALLFNFFSALAAVLGTVVLFSFGQTAMNLSAFLVPITAGGFIYIAVSDLLPELHKETRWLWSLGQLIFLTLGVGIMYLLKIYFS